MGPRHEVLCPRVCLPLKPSPVQPPFLLPTSPLPAFSVQAALASHFWVQKGQIQAQAPHLPSNLLPPPPRLILFTGPSNRLSPGLEAPSPLPRPPALS